MDNTLVQLEKELELLYDYNIAQYDYQPNSNGRGRIAHNKEWGGSIEQKQLYKRINQQIQLINRRKRKLGMKV